MSSVSRCLVLSAFVRFVMLVNKYKTRSYLLAASFRFCSHAAFYECEIFTSLLIVNLFVGVAELSFLV